MILLDIPFEFVSDLCLYELRNVAPGPLDEIVTFFTKIGFCQKQNMNLSFGIEKVFDI